jgi:chitodextrinase
VKTADATPPSTIADLAVSNPTSDSLTLTWTAPGDEWNKSTAKGYMVKYSTVGQINEANWGSTTTLPQSWRPKANGTTETLVLSGLSSNTKYWFAIRAYDEASNYGGVSNSPSGTTLAAQAAGLSTELLTVAALATVAVVAVLALVLKKKK